MRPREESNLRTQIRSLPLYPLSYGAHTQYARWLQPPQPAPAAPASEVTGGTRTHDHRDHNPGLYQLSYGHRAQAKHSPNPRPAA